MIQCIEFQTVLNGECVYSVFVPLDMKIDSPIPAVLPVRLRFKSSRTSAKDVAPPQFTDAHKIETLDGLVELFTNASENNHATGIDDEFFLDAVFADLAVRDARIVSSSEDEDDIPVGMCVCKRVRRSLIV